MGQKSPKLGHLREKHLISLRSHLIINSVAGLAVGQWGWSKLAIVVENEERILIELDYVPAIKLILQRCRRIKPTLTHQDNTQF